MSIFEFIAKKTNFCVGVISTALIWMLLLAGVGLGLDYVLMYNSHMELFWFCVLLAATWVPVCLTLQFIMIGLIRPLTLKPFRPLNENIVGLNLKPGITVGQLNETIDALKKFAIKFTILSFIMCTIAMAPFVTNTIIKNYEIIYIMSQVVICTLMVLVYSVVAFLSASAKAEKVRRKAYHILADFKKQQRNKPASRRRR